jgi:hypothetical protein
MPRKPPDIRLLQRSLLSVPAAAHTAQLSHTAEVAYVRLTTAAQERPLALCTACFANSPPAHTCTLAGMLLMNLCLYATPAALHIPPPLLSYCQQPASTHLYAGWYAADECHQLVAALHTYAHVPVPLISWRLQCPLQECRAVVEPESNNDTQIKDVTRSQHVTSSCCSGKNNSQTAKLTKNSYAPDVVQQNSWVHRTRQVLQAGHYAN